MVKLYLHIPYAPRTKKTHNQIVRTQGLLRILPSKAWRLWQQAAVPFIKRQLAEQIEEIRSVLPLKVPLNCAAVFYRDRTLGDAVGYYQGLADLLETAGVVANDQWIYSWDGSRLELDRQKPRTELVLTFLSTQNLTKEIV